MGLFDFIKKDNKKIEEPTKQSEKSPYYGDLSKTNILNELFKIPRKQRDDKWNAKFLENVADASFTCCNPQVFEGPDGFPYFQLNIPEPYKQFQCFVIRHMKDDFLLDKGFGVVINPSKGQPDWVFSYGDIVNYHIRNEFYTKSENWDLPKQEIIKQKEEVFLGQPSESILPNSTRNVIRDFLKSIGINDAKLLLMNRRKPNGFLQELVFNLTPDKFEKNEHYEGVMKSIAWYLPRHYSYVSMNESNFKDNFKPL
jgi:hypothetical protein